MVTHIILLGGQQLLTLNMMAKNITNTWVSILRNSDPLMRTGMVDCTV